MFHLQDVITWNSKASCFSSNQKVLLHKLWCVRISAYVEFKLQSDCIDEHIILFVPHRKNSGTEKFGWVNFLHLHNRQSYQDCTIAL